MPDCYPFREPGQNPTLYAQAAITGCRFVAIKTGVNADGDGHAQAFPCPLNGKAYGVASRDTAVGGLFMVYRWGDVPILCSGALSHGQRVASDATGRAIPWVDFATNGAPLGTVLADAPDATFAKISLELGA